MWSIIIIADSVSFRKDSLQVFSIKSWCLLRRLYPCSVHHLCIATTERFVDILSCQLPEWAQDVHNIPCVLLLWTPQIHDYSRTLRGWMHTQRSKEHYDQQEVQALHNTNVTAKCTTERYLEWRRNTIDNQSRRWRCWYWQWLALWICGCLSRRDSQSGVLQKATGVTGGALDPIIVFFGFGSRSYILYLPRYCHICTTTCLTPLNCPIHISVSSWVEYLYSQERSLAAML